MNIKNWKTLNTKIIVLGSGAFGTAIANQLAKVNSSTWIYGINEFEINDININHKNKAYFPNELSKNLKATTDIKVALKGAKIIFVALPSSQIQNVFETKVIPNLKKPVIIVNLSKGFDKANLDTISKMLEKIIPEKYNDGILKLSGPSFATEIMNNDTTMFVLASKNSNALSIVKNHLKIDTFKIVFSNEIEAVEMISIFKNAYALALGVNRGLGNGKNSEAFLLYETTNEIKKMLSSLNLDEKIIYSPAGIWDLVLTCTSEESRNFKFGCEIGKKNLITKNDLNIKTTVEGIGSLEMLYKIAKKKDLDLPILISIYNIIFELKEPKMVLNKYFKNKNIDLNF